MLALKNIPNKLFYMQDPHPELKLPSKSDPDQDPEPKKILPYRYRIRISLMYALPYLGINEVDILCVGAELGGHNAVPGAGLGAGGGQHRSLRLAHLTHAQAAQDIHQPLVRLPLHL
jgi:hypothetical protein